jgi:hypothetical protein
MDEGNKSSRSSMSVIFAVLLIAAMGVAGYFTGQYIDTKAAEEEAAAIVPAVSTTILDENEAFGIYYEYPKTWEESVSDNSLAFTNENGSVIRYAYYPEEESTVLECDDACIQVGDYMRKEVGEFELEGETVAEWNIYEDVNGVYKYYSNDGFSYVLSSEDDLTELDNVMKNIGRL